MQQNKDAFLDSIVGDSLSLGSDMSYHNKRKLNSYEKQQQEEKEMWSKMNPD